MTEVVDYTSSSSHMYVVLPSRLIYLHLDFSAHDLAVSASVTHPYPRQKMYRKFDSFTENSPFHPVRSVQYSTCYIYTNKFETQVVIASVQIIGVLGSLALTARLVWYLHTNRPGFKQSVSLPGLCSRC